jgi:PAS domain S-box-containing protein
MRRPRIPQPVPRDYTSEINLLSHQLAALTGRWIGVAPPPPSLVEAVEELTTTMEELHAMNEDLTQSQQDAQDTQRRYRELFEWVPEAYLVTDLHSFIQEANRAAAQLLHIEHSLLVGFPLASFVAQEMRAFFQTQLAWLRNGAEIHEWVMRVQPLHQPPVPVVCHVAPARDADEALAGLRWLLRDLTAQQQAQETLAQHVRELTAKLDQANLHMRELHHRMNNNLQVVSSLLDWGEHDIKDPRGRAIFLECQGRIRAMALVHELLYRASDPERIDLGHYLRRIALQVFVAYGIDRERVHLTL